MRLCVSLLFRFIMAYKNLITRRRLKSNETKLLILLFNKKVYGTVFVSNSITPLRVTNISNFQKKLILKGAK